MPFKAMVARTSYLRYLRVYLYMYIYFFTFFPLKSYGLWYQLLHSCTRCTLNSFYTDIIYTEKNIYFVCPFHVILCLELLFLYTDVLLFDTWFPTHIHIYMHLTMHQRLWNNKHIMLLNFFKNNFVIKYTEYLCFLNIFFVHP